MSVVQRWLNGTLKFWRDQKDEHLRWQQARQPDSAELRRSRVLAEQALLTELKKQAQVLEQELKLNQAKYDNELAMVKIQCKQDLKDYQQYLEALDQLKRSLRDSYAHLPEAVAYTIHHHAKQLLNRMWDAREPQEKIKIEMQLIQFLTAVHEDSLSSSLNRGGNGMLPNKALAFIGRDS
ncbi:hypothetical protein [Methylomonas sp. MgM2]